jgi:hypothetical protein
VIHGRYRLVDADAPVAVGIGADAGAERNGTERDAHHRHHLVHAHPPAVVTVSGALCERAVARSEKRDGEADRREDASKLAWHVAAVPPAAPDCTLGAMGSAP